MTTVITIIKVSNCVSPTYNRTVDESAGYVYLESEVRVYVIPIFVQVVAMVETESKLK